jgi:hypothetical protein
MGLRPTASSGSKQTLAVTDLAKTIRRELPSGTRLQGHFLWGLLSWPKGLLLVVDTILTFEFDTDDKLVS